MDGDACDRPDKTLGDMAAPRSAAVRTLPPTDFIGDNMEYMLQHGQTVYLKCNNDTLLRRLKAARSQRPLIASKNDQELALFIESETARREPGYLKAEYICPGDRLESRDQISETVDYIEQLLKLK